MVDAYIGVGSETERLEKEMRESERWEKETRERNVREI